MRIRFSEVLMLAAVCSVLGCTNADRDRARERGAEAKQKAREAADELRRDARKAGNDARRALQKGGISSSPGESPEAKIRDSEQALRTAGRDAIQKLDKATMIAQAKTKLAGSLGLSALANIDVGVEGETLILTGTVGSEAQKEQAGDAAAQVPGVSRVANRLKVEP